MNKFLKEFKDRGFFYQCTNEEELKKLKPISDLIVLRKVYMLAVCYK